MGMHNGFKRHFKVVLDVAAGCISAGQVLWPEGYRAHPLSPTLGCLRVRILAVAEDPSLAHARAGGGEDPMLPPASARGT
eukprot:3920949-Pleurochrysis_carterae.AAC.1